MSGGDGYLTNPLFREIAALMTQAGIPFRVEQGAKHFHVKFTHLGVERTQILHLGPNNKRSTARKTVIRFRKIVEAERAWREQQTSPELELEQPAMSEQEKPAAEAPSPSFGLALHVINEEPRVLDTDLASELGITEPRMIRRTIKANISELAELGGVHSANALIAGNETTIYHLNEEQAALICMLSRTPQAKKARAEIIRVFTAWRRGQLAPAAASIDTDAMKANAQLAASAAGGAAKNAVTPHMRQIDGRLARFDDRLTEQAKWSQQWRRETNAKIDALLTILAKPSAVALQMNDYIEIGGVYEVAGIPMNVARRGILSANIRRSLDDYAIDQHVLPAHATVRGQKVRHWPKALVADWLADEGHALIERHLRANGAQSAQLRLIQS